MLRRISRILADWWLCREAEDMSDEIIPTDGDKLPEQDLDAFEFACAMQLWNGEGHIDYGVEVIEERFFEDDVEYAGFACFHDVRGIHYFTGFLKGVEAARQSLQQRAA